jgi:hypothetical protein
MVIEDHTNCEQLVLFLRRRIRALNKQIELEQRESAWVFAKYAALRMGIRNQDEISGRR